MRDFAFYNTLAPANSLGERLVRPLRRLVRYLLRPLFQQLEGMLHQLDADQSQTRATLAADLARLRSELASLRTELRTDLARQAEESTARHRERLEALEDDHLAATRRLAQLEDQMEALHPRSAA